MSEDATTLTPPVPDDGNLHIKFRLQDEVAMLFIRVGIVSVLWEKQFHCKTSSFSTTGLHAVRTVRPGGNIVYEDFFYEVFGIQHKQCSSHHLFLTVSDFLFVVFLFL